MKTIYQLIKDNCMNFEICGPFGMKNFCCFELEKTRLQCGYFCDEIKDDVYILKNVFYREINKLKLYIMQRLKQEKMAGN